MGRREALHSSDLWREKDHAPKGKTPVTRPNAKWESISTMSAIANRRKVRYKRFEDVVNAPILVDSM